MRKVRSRDVWLVVLALLGGWVNARADSPNPVAGPPRPEALPDQGGSTTLRSNGATDPRAAGTQPASGVTLTGTIGLALRANPDLRSATERIRIADSILDRARAEFYPTLSLTEAFVDTNIAGLAFFLEANQRRVSLSQNLNHPGFVGNFSTLVTLKQNLYSGGRRTAEELAAE